MTTRSSRQRGTSMPEYRDKITGWLLLLPALLLLILVFAYPIGRALWLSLFTRNLGTKLEPVFSGLDNYTRMIGDGRFWQFVQPPPSDLLSAPRMLPYCSA